MHEVDLSSTIELSHHGFNDEIVVERRDLRPHRQAVPRRGVNDGHVARAHERHVQRPRYGRRRHGQDVHRLPELLDRLLVNDTELLLLVDHEEPQVLELNVLLNEPVRAYDDVQLPSAQPLQDFLLLLLRAET